MDRVRIEYREEPCKTALNRVKNMRFHWSLNPYMGCWHRCTFCYVRAFEKRADRAYGDDYGVSIRVKPNVVEVLEKEVSRPRWKREWVAIGSATDPYQPAEGKYKLTRGCVEVLGRHATPFSIITRSPMIIRDIDVLTEAAKQAEVSVTFSVPTLDEEVWRKTEPSTAHPRQRLRALETLVDAGIKASVGMAPILPGISDDPEMLNAVVRAARDAGACGVWANVLYLKPGTREHFMNALARDFPEQVANYEALYRDRAYIPRAMAAPLHEFIGELKETYEIEDRRENPVLPSEQLELSVA